ncbi:hypothetical protein [Burkholderia sp. lyk4-R2A-23]|uniref:hypothetical protein n=1 Tax=Burkholderia sp. lyk4-R2A-23 TaxID=3040284 RepID=UPI0025506D6F|nr:hypothetical protein [Burkholderia sp. lyk4-R2A-23]
MNEKIQRMIEECKRQEESCLYTSASLFEWLKALRYWRVAFITLPIVLGAVAAAPILIKQSGLDWLTALCALLAGVFPAVYKGLDWDINLKSVADSANGFKTLQDRFRRAWSIAALEAADEFHATFDDLMNRMDAVRSTSLTAPERYFMKAKAKIEAGHYRFIVDDDDIRGQNEMQATGEWK